MLVRNETPGLIAHGEMKLIPGINTVDMKAWLEARKHKSIRVRIEKGMLVEESDVDAFLESQQTDTPSESEVGAYSEEDKNYLKTLSVPNAKNVVAETFDLPLLQAWKEREDRNQVKGALNKQIELLGEALPDRDRSKMGQMSTGGEPVEENLGHNPKANADD